MGNSLDFWSHRTSFSVTELCYCSLKSSIVNKTIQLGRCLDSAIDIVFAHYILKVQICYVFVCFSCCHSLAYLSCGVKCLLDLVSRVL